MIHVGLTGWGDHDTLYAPGTKTQDKLRAYARHYPVVEVDSSFYAVQPKERFERWAEEAGERFSFVVKAYQGMTGHLRGKPYFRDAGEMYAAFCESIEPIARTGQLKAVLFQYPPWFDCTRENVQTLRDARRRMEGLPCALEFRHRSWFEPAYRERTLDFMAREGWIHSVCDEPQAGDGSVPIVLRATDKVSTIVRMHGRNAEGWRGRGEGSDWRAVRYLYRYSDEELAEWVERLAALERESADVYVLFNNNSGGDAAANAKRLMAQLGLRTPDGRDPEEAISAKRPEPPVQLDLFGE